MEEPVNVENHPSCKNIVDIVMVDAVIVDPVSVEKNPSCKNMVDMVMVDV